MAITVLQLIGISAQVFLILTFVLVMVGVGITLYLTYVGLDSDVHSPAIAQDDGEETGS
ncbi:MAG: hypothetical protein SVG88_10265 [Halobacteriales archaeon]|nr:hypothetical protein [Halobacteriales archaeon]